MPDPEWIPIEQAARRLGFVHRTVVNYLCRGRLEGKKIRTHRRGKSTRWAYVSRQSLEALEWNRKLRQAERGLPSVDYDCPPEPAGPPRCPQCTAVVENEGDLCDLCQALADVPYCHYRPLTPIQAVAWDSQCVENR